MTIGRIRRKKAPQLRLCFRSKYIPLMLAHVGSKHFPDIDWMDDNDLSSIVQSTTERLFSVLIERTSTPYLEKYHHIEPLLKDDLFCHEFAAILVSFKQDIYENIKGTRADRLLDNVHYGEIEILSDDGDFLMALYL